MNNTQRSERIAPAAINGAVDLHSLFLTIQGEGPYVGRQSIFLRLAGCNLQCPRCDTEYTNGRGLYLPDKIIDRIGMLHGSMRHAPLIVITGGEPFRQNLTDLFEALTSEGYLVQVETNGTLPPVGQNNRVKIVCSPKTGKVHGQIERHAIAYKYVIHHDHISDVDGLPTTALGHPAAPQLARPPPRMPRHQIYVQPEDSGNVDENWQNIQAAKRSCEIYGYTFGIQLHKLIQVP